MHMDFKLKRAAAFLVLVLMLVPACTFAQGENVVVSETVKAACLSSGGQWIDAPYVVQVVSPYGTQSVVLRDEPSDSYDAMAVLMVRQEITVIAETESFVYVLLEDGSAGWLADDEVKK